jgi:hypothetical protein
MNPWPSIVSTAPWAAGAIYRKVNGMSLDDGIKDLRKADFAAESAAVTPLIFSKDRAMQLDALLTSLYLHCHDRQLLRPIHVLFTCTNGRHQAQYRELASAYDQVLFIAERNFTAQVLEILRSTAKILFLVDDSLFIRGFSLQQLGDLLEEYPDTAGVSLRLGTNTDYCYPLQVSQSLPLFQNERNGFLLYDWLVSEADFGYPLEVSSSCYRAADILRVLAGGSFSNPNALEGAMALNARQALLPAKRFLLCPVQTLAFSYPVNRVQSCCANRYESLKGYTVEYLADLFAQGRRIDVDAYHEFVPRACHQPVELQFK